MAYKAYKNYDNHKTIFYVKFGYEISKIEDKVMEIPGMVEKILSFVVSKVSCFSKVLVLSFL